MALAYELGGYSDWYLPSKDELMEIYNTVGNGGPDGNIGGFANQYYWSSSEANMSAGWFVNFGDDSDYGVGSKYNSYKIRVIRAF